MNIYEESFETKMDEKEIVDSISKVIPFVETNQVDYSLKNQWKERKNKKSASKLSKYFLTYGVIDLKGNKGYIVDRNTEKLDMFTPKILMNIDEKNALIELSSKYKMFELAILFFTTLVCTLAFYGESLMRFLLILIVLYGALFLTSRVFYKYRSRKIINLIKSVIEGDLT